MITVRERFAGGGLRHEPGSVPVEAAPAMVDRLAARGFRRMEAASSRPESLPRFAEADAAPRATRHEVGLDMERVPAAGREAERLLGRTPRRRVPRMGDA